MNLQTLIIFALAIAGAGYALYKFIKSRGACEDCGCSCPVKEQMK